MTSRVLVAGLGNIFCGDDGFGPAVVRDLLAAPVPESVKVVDYGIRGMHLAYDLLEEWDALILIDAVPERGRPGRLGVLEIGAEHVGRGGQLDAHGMDPATVIANLAHLGGTLPGRTLLVGCEAADVEEGIGLSPRVQATVHEAARLVLDVVATELERATVS